MKINNGGEGGKQPGPKRKRERTNRTIGRERPASPRQRFSGRGEGAKKTVCPNGFWGGARGVGEGKKGERCEGREKTEKRKENYTVFRFSFGQCTFAARKASSRSPPLSPPGSQPFLLPPPSPFSLAPTRSLALQHNLWSTPDPESYLYDICVHYLAQGVQGTGISSRDELCRFGKGRWKRRARVPSLSASEELIQPPERRALSTIYRVRGRIISLASLLSPWDPPFRRALC